MFGEPKDVEGECNSHLYIADNYGDNHATMRCGLPKGHKGPHCEEFERKGGKVVVTWENDERGAKERGEENLRRWNEAGCPDNWDW
jgi:hypothetical protein